MIFGPLEKGTERHMERSHAFFREKHYMLNGVTLCRR